MEDRTFSMINGDSLVIGVSSVDSSITNFGKELVDHLKLLFVSISGCRYLENFRGDI